MKRITLAAILLSGCVESQTLNLDTFYRRDVRINVDGKTTTGHRVLDGGKAYKFEFYFPGKVDLFTFQTCHREIILENASSSEGPIFGRKKNIVRVEYDPKQGIESDKYCPIEVGGYEKSQGRHSWGFIDIKTPEADLDATLTCNGLTGVYGGVSICQSRKGMIQRIAFAQDVEVSPDVGCEMEVTEGKVFEWELATGHCVYAFRSESGSIHRLTTMGYDGILIREE